MCINRTGYYKWVNRRENIYEINRRLLTELIKEEHKRHKAYGYHRLAFNIRKSTGWIISDNLVHKCCKFENIKSHAKHYKYKSSGEEHITFKNKVNGNWEVSRPLELVASDMTCLFFKGKRVEWTYVLDVYNNEIVASAVSNKQGDSIPYFSCLNQLIEKTKEQPYPVTLHTDQGNVYSSGAFLKAHEHYNIKRSMSRVGTPTDNPVIESINGWIKAEMYADKQLKNEINYREFIKNFINYFNTERPSYKLKYKTPVQYRIEQGFE